MIKWLNAHGAAVQALTGILTMVVAIAALIGVKVQIDAAERLQQAQSARDIYREYLNLSIGKPEFATPNYCAMADSKEQGAYENYVQYLLYTSEQLLSADDGWEATMIGHLQPHRELLCGEGGWGGDTPEVKALIDRFREGQCKAFKSACS